MMLIPKIGKPQAEVEGYRRVDSEQTYWGKNARTTKFNEVNFVLMKLSAWGIRNFFGMNRLEVCGNGLNEDS